MDRSLTYHFDEIEHTVRQDIHATAARLNGALDDLRCQISPLQQTWTREAADAYRAEQLRWQQAAAGLNDILVRLAAAVGAGAADMAQADRKAAGSWGR